MFRLKSDGISCISISYEDFGAFFVCFLGVLAEKRWNIVHVNELRGFWGVFRVFSWSFGWKVMEYLACQWVTWVLACFSCVLLVFRLKSDGISCMSISYMLCSKTGSTWRIASILGDFPLLYMEGNEVKVIKSALKNAGKYNLYYFRKRRAALLRVFDHCLCEQVLCFWGQVLWLCE